jgi:hypothetical protein
VHVVEDLSNLVLVFGSYVPALSIMLIDQSVYGLESVQCILQQLSMDMSSNENAIISNQL